jgi:hypothetical protein
LDWPPGSITLPHDWCISEAQAQLDREESRDNQPWAGAGTGYPTSSPPDRKYERPVVHQD